MSDDKIKLPEDGPQSEILIYQTEDGETRIEARMIEESVWLTQKQMAQLFQKDIRTVNGRLQNIFREEELRPEETVRKFRIVQNEGKRQVARLKVILEPGKEGGFTVYAPSLPGRLSEGETGEGGVAEKHLRGRRVVS